MGDIPAAHSLCWLVRGRDPPTLRSFIQVPFSCEKQKRNKIQEITLSDFEMMNLRFNWCGWMLLPVALLRFPGCWLPVVVQLKGPARTHPY